MFWFAAWTASCCPNANNNGIIASPCSPPSPCGIVCDTPSSSSTLRWGTVEHAHKWKCGWKHLLTPVPALSTWPCAESSAWAMHSHPAWVESAYWCGVVADLTAGPNCWAIARATNQRITSPLTMPRMPPSGFVRAVIRLDDSTTWGTWTLANSPTWLGAKRHRPLFPKLAMPKRPHQRAPKSRHAWLDFPNRPTLSNACADVVLHWPPSPCTPCWPWSTLSVATTWKTSTLSLASVRHPDCCPMLLLRTPTWVHSWKDLARTGAHFSSQRPAVGNECWGPLHPMWPTPFWGSRS